MAHRTFSSRSTPILYTVKITKIAEGTSQGKLDRFILRHSAGDGLISARILDGYALVNYSSKDACEKASSKLNGKQLNGVAVRAKVKGAVSEVTTVKINHLSSKVNEQELSAICTQFGDVASVKVNDGYGYVNFEAYESAVEASEYLNTKHVKLGGQTVTARIQNSQADEHQKPLAASHPEKHTVPHFSRHPVSNVLRPPPSVQPSHLPPQLGSLATPKPKSNPSSIHGHKPPHSHPPSKQHIYAPPSASCTIKVELNGPGLSSESLLQYFGQFGVIEGTPVIHSGTPDYAYVNFSSPEEAVKACKRNVVNLKMVNLTIKLSNKPRPAQTQHMQMDTQLFLSDNYVVDKLIAGPSFNEIESKLVPFDLHVKPSPDQQGIHVTGSHEKVAIAMALLKTESTLLQSKIVRKCEKLHFSAIPLLSNPKLFESIQQEHCVELYISRNDGSEEKPVSFCASVSHYMKTPTPMKAELFENYLHNKAEVKAPVWYFKDDNDVYAKMSNADSNAVEQLYKKSFSKSSNFLHTIGGFEYRYEFVPRLTQTNTTTLKQRKIKRSLISNSGTSTKNQKLTIQCKGLQANVDAALSILKKRIDDQASYSMDFEVESELEDEIFKMASEYCIDAQQMPAKIVLIGERDYVNKVCIDLKARISTIRGSLLPLQSKGPYWEPQNDKIELKTVEKYSEEWTSIVKKFKSTVPHAILTTIQRIQNKWLWDKYAFCRSRMCEKNGENGINEELLFHGTRDTTPESVYHSDHGFDFRFSRSGMWGKGAYFASDAGYSNNYAYDSKQGKQIFLAFVLTGDSVNCPGNSSLDKPPVKHKGSNGIEERYDSVNGLSGTTKIYIVYDHDKSYPAYLITYT